MTNGLAHLILEQRILDYTNLWHQKLGLERLCWLDLCWLHLGWCPLLAPNIVVVLALLPRPWEVLRYPPSWWSLASRFSSKSGLDHHSKYLRSSVWFLPRCNSVGYNFAGEICMNDVEFQQILICYHHVVPYVVWDNDPDCGFDIVAGGFKVCHSLTRDAVFLHVLYLISYGCYI